MFENGQMTDFAEHFDHHIFSGTKCDRDKLIYFLQKRGVIKIELGIKRDPMGSENVRKGDQSRVSSLLPSSMGVPPHWV